jgi:cytochrome c-type biogenesis protein CcmH
VTQSAFYCGAVRFLLLTKPNLPAPTVGTPIRYAAEGRHSDKWLDKGESIDYYSVVNGCDYFTAGQEMKRVFIPVLLLLILSVAAPAQDAIYDEEVLRQARAIYNQIMSPYCPGKTLSNCSSGGAEQMRIDIRNRLSEGEPPEMIMASLVEEWGESVLAAPKNEGVGRLAWFTPFVAILFGLVVIVAFVHRYYRREEEAVSATYKPDTTLRARVEEELKTHEG